MVQYMGNTLQGGMTLRNVVKALEREPKDGPTYRVCIEGTEEPELSGFMK
jgi:hypothetical protein